MSTKYLKRFFKPNSIVVFGASEEPENLGGIVIRNLQDSGFDGRLYAVLRDGSSSVFGVPCYAGVADLPEMPDLAVICSRPERVPELIRKLGANQVRAAIILSGGHIAQGEQSQPLREAVKEAARPYGIRIIGPECLGILVPGHNMNASYSHINVLKGKVAYVGQSGIVGTAMIDWATGQGIGFSHFLTLGDSVDVDLPSIIDYLAADPYTQAIVLQLNKVSRARHFVSAVRAAARTKLVLVLKSAFLHEQGQLEQHQGLGLPSEDQVYDAVLRRAGVVRVSTSDEVFNALATLSRSKLVRGERLALICNGMGPNALAMDILKRRGGQLAQLAESTLDALAEVMPPFWNRQHPLDLNATATPQHFAKALEWVSKDPGVDAVLVIHAPTRLAPCVETAEAVVQVARQLKTTVLTSWMGRASAIGARNIFNAAQIPTYITPEKAVEGFLHMVAYRRNQEVMRETPPSFVLQEHSIYRMRAKALVQQARSEGRDYLHHAEAADLIASYGLPVSTSYYAKDVAEVIKVAKRIQNTIAVKALHRDNRYPFFYDQVSTKRWHDLALDLYSDQEVRHRVTRLDYRVRERYVDEDLYGYVVQEMKRGFQSMQMNVGLSRHPVFGPMILFGVGGYTVDVLGDRQLGVPPLNLALARTLVQQTRIYRILQEHSHQVERDLHWIAQMLVKISQIAVDLPEVSALEINPMLLNKTGLLAVDAAVALAEPAELCIPPYPEHLREWATLLRSGREVELRPIRGEDEPAHLEFYRSLSPETVRLRYFYSRSIPNHHELANWTQIDYDREMAFIASAPKQDASNDYETLGVVRGITDPDNVTCEFSIVIRDDLQGEGLGRMLMTKLIDYCRSRGTLQIMGSTLPNNLSMQNLASALGFQNSFNMEEEVVEMRLSLHPPTEDWQFHRLAQH